MINKIFGLSLPLTGGTGVTGVAGGSSTMDASTGGVSLPPPPQPKSIRKTDDMIK